MHKKAFTLIEVMVSVMIISVVIMALLKMQGNSTHIFSKLISKLEINQYTSFFLSNKDYGFTREDISLDKFLREFRVEDDLRRKLKNIKVKINYDKLDRYGDSIDNQENSSNSSMVLEVGRSSILLNNSKVSILRLRIQ